MRVVYRARGVGQGLVCGLVARIRFHCIGSQRRCRFGFEASRRWSELAKNSEVCNVLIRAVQYCAAERGTKVVLDPVFVIGASK